MSQLFALIEYQYESHCCAGQSAEGESSQVLMCYSPEGLERHLPPLLEQLGLASQLQALLQGQRITIRRRGCGDCSLEWQLAKVGLNQPVDPELVQETKDFAEEEGGESKEDEESEEED